MEDAILENLSTRELLNALDAAKHNYGREHASRKVQALRILQTRSIRQASLILKYHEILCFLQAYPDNRELLALVEEALSGFRRLVQDAQEHTTERNHGQLDGSGISGTAITYPFSYATARWLVDSFSDDVCIDWDGFENEEKLLALLPQLVSYLENEALDDQELETRRWLTLGRDEKADLRVLLDLFSRSGLAAQTAETMYDLLDLQVCWRLQGRGASRTLAKLPTARVHYQSRPLSRRKEGLVRLVRKPLTSLRRARKAKAGQLVNAARSALAVR
ncbi:MAG: hypothetical protein ACYS8L_09345, partial [Planctomycetota bacterium]